MKPYRALRSRLLLLALLLPLAAHPADEAPATPASGVSDLSGFGSLIVLHDGRKMPLDTYARIKLLQFSGKTSFQRQPAVDWLARVCFTPEAARPDKIFLINHPQVVEALRLETDEHRRYSFEELEPSVAQLMSLARTASDMDPEKRTVIENEILRLAHNLDAYRGLARSFLFSSDAGSLQIQSETLCEQLGLPEGRDLIKLTELLQKSAKLNELLAGPEASSVQALTRRANHMLHRHRGHPPMLIPAKLGGEELWLAPWDAISASIDDPALLPLLEQLDQAASAYREGRQLEFDMILRSFRDAVLSSAHPDRQIAHIDQELLYNRLDLFYRSEVLYGFCFLLGLVALIGGSSRVRLASLALLILALLAHTAGILFRMDIMGRPPVTNLYSTFLFVGWMSALLCAFMEFTQKNSLGSLAGGFSGLALLLLSRRFISVSDPMGVLVAVLDSNFWLATHVITITMGYAGCVLAGVIGHFYLLQAIINPRNHTRLRSLYNAVFAVLGFGFTFSFLGTMLGGVWADQSWGRFWGWDPKENGALLIVLWCAILYHARIARWIREVGMAAGSIVGIIVVLIAWVGVNLLGVGLHSYGFTSGVAGGLLLYTCVQILIMVLLVIVAKKRLASAPSPYASGPAAAKE